MKKRKWIIQLIIPGLLALAACREDNDAIQERDTVQLQIEASVENTTKTVKSVWKTGDKLGLIVTEEGSASTPYLLDKNLNSPVTYTEGLGWGNTSVYLSEKRADIRAYWPYSESFDLKKIQLTQQDITDSDLSQDFLLSTLDGTDVPVILNASPSAELRMKHVSARIRIILQTVGSSKQVKCSTMTFNGYSADATLSLLDYSITTGAKGTFTPALKDIMLGTTTSEAICDFMLPPQSAASGSIALSLLVDTKPYQTTIKSDGKNNSGLLTWESGKVYTYTYAVKVGEDIKLTGISIAGWTDKGNSNVELK